MVTASAGGRSFDNWDTPITSGVSGADSQVSEPEKDEIPDILPEEEELGSDTFIDNQ